MACRENPFLPLHVVTIHGYQIRYQVKDLDRS
jgi:hypothetical protein